MPFSPEDMVEWFHPINKSKIKEVAHLQEIQKLAEEFAACRKTLLALGDENRQHLILEMILIGKCEGVRVGEITEKTHLSRPAVSHHLKILKDAGLIKMRREGTKNYYYFDADAEAIQNMLQMLTHASAIMKSLPDRSEKIYHPGGEDAWNK